jgi:hypothetical protein
MDRHMKKAPERSGASHQTGTRPYAAFFSLKTPAKMISRTNA